MIPVGTDAVLVELDAADGATAAIGLAGWIRDRVAAREVVPAARTVLVDGVDQERLTAALAAWSPERARPAGPLIELPVAYDGADLAEVARLWDMTQAEAVATHEAVEFTVAFCGFAPGFAYLGGLPRELALPRLETPRARVPAGSVALADAWCGVYPGASPGGWRLLGRTEVTLWDPATEPPALLRPGTRVRFRAAT